MYLHISSYKLSRCWNKIAVDGEMKDNLDYKEIIFKSYSVIKNN